MSIPIQNESTALQTISTADSGRVTAGNLMTDVATMTSIMKVAELMAGGRCTVPTHLQKNPSDCMAVVMQSMQWNMNPFAVAQKTHVSQGGQLGYEAQLISAVICANAPVKEEAPEYEYIGDWSKVLGKVAERESAKGGKYYVATYTKADEVGLGVICRLTLKGESKPRETTLMMSQCYPRFSTQWATDPKQQISYAAIRKWSRLYSPGTILGVYTPDEFDQAQPRDMGKVEVVQQEPAAPSVLEAAQHAAEEGVAVYSKFWKDTGAANRKAIGTAEHERLKGVAVDADKARTVTPEATGPSFDTVMKLLNEAETMDALFDAGNMIDQVVDDSERKALDDKFEERKFVLEAS